jgi:hypothetical protein
MHKAESAWYVITEHPSGHALDDLLALASEPASSEQALIAFDNSGWLDWDDMAFFSPLEQSSESG